MRIDIFNPQGNYIGYEERDDGDTGILVTKETRTYAERKLISIERYAGGASGVTAAISYKMEWEYGTGETGGAGSTGQLIAQRTYQDGTTISYKETFTYNDAGVQVDKKTYQDGVTLSSCSGQTVEICEDGCRRVTNFCNNY